MTSVMIYSLLNSHDRSYAGVSMRVESTIFSRGRVDAPQSSYRCSLA